ncbi:hypothetical protein BU16DRAFT_235928 [Lophium mytilinum]|uniref:Uncharacterized protein n=1 Tax=Lophium mytilinum TaxID=390894 RepID=A0A6A6R8A7_9PEZI|nr:hypothetical protein BU16DRAFT_235928 [Lophium mytilinum]
MLRRRAWDRDGRVLFVSTQDGGTVDATPRAGGCLPSLDLERPVLHLRALSVCSGFDHPRRHWRWVRMSASPQSVYHVKSLGQGGSPVGPRWARYRTGCAARCPLCVTFFSTTPDSDSPFPHERPLPHRMLHVVAKLATASTFHATTSGPMETSAMPASTRTDLTRLSALCFDCGAARPPPCSPYVSTLHHTDRKPCPTRTHTTDRTAFAGAESLAPSGVLFAIRGTLYTRF